MASQSSKKLATANTKTLNQLHMISAGVNVLVILAIFILHRPASFLPWLLLSIPSFVLQYNLESSGRPQYVKEKGYDKLVKSGQDIHQQGGLFEYFFDVVYLTWLFDLLMIIFGSNKVWWGYLIIPGFACFKLYGIVSPFLKKSQPQQQAAPATEEATTSTSGKSKRQQKLEARREKGPTMKYR
ncbi:Late endosome and vacuole interface protein 10 [Spathaspora sp. JA1]|nr:Late endosome and vacuole interface protein 10 [Spathaspora sp. JA1]